MTTYTEAPCSETAQHEPHERLGEGYWCPGGSVQVTNAAEAALDQVEELIRAEALKKDFHQSEWRTHLTDLEHIETVRQRLEEERKA